MNNGDYSYFTHLHVHSQFSLLEGTASIEQLVARAAEDGVRALALTDSHALYGAVAFCEACTAVNITPIIGLTVRVASPVPEAMRLGGHGQLVLLATGATGYRSLCGLASLLQTEQQGRVAAWQTLKPFTDGVIGVDAGHGGWAARYFRAGQLQSARRYASFFGGLFEQNGYFGLAINGEKDVSLARELVQLGGRFGIRPLATHPVYTLDPADTPKLRLLAAIDDNCRLDAVAPERLPTHYHPTCHWQNPDTIIEQFADFPEAIENVETIVQQCESPLPDGRPIWPNLNLPDDKSDADALREMAQAGLLEKYGRSPNPAIQTRLDKELGIITQAGFTPLFLLVAQITQFARETAVPFNTRGSVANSLVAFCVGITNVDPIEHDLLFERFLNPERANMPDIDLDFCSRRRDEVLHFVRDTFGADKVALVATVSTMQAKSAVRETGKAYGLTEAEIKHLTKLLPRSWHPDPRRRDKRTLADVIDEAKTAVQKQALQDAFALVGQPHHLSVHPGGVVIAPTAMTDFVPVQMAPKGFLITQYDHQDVEKIGLPKIDLLGIRALTVLADTAELIDPPLDLTQIPLDDGETAVLLEAADSVGVFQCESTGAQRTMRQLRTKTVADLAVANAFFKPGPAMGGMAKAFVRRYRGEEAVGYLHAALEPILSSTQGVLLFQEQILRIATEVAGLNWSEADILRRGMSKFKAKEMAQMQARFVLGCQKQAAFSEADAATLWEQVMAFAGYGFNKGHATAYADISYRSAYLKAHYPAQFLTARLKDHGGFHHPAIYIAEARRLGIPVLPPHVNVSGRRFTYSGIGDQGSGIGKALALDPRSPIPDPQPSIWMGLGQVRDVRRATVRAIVGKRPFSSLKELLHKVPSMRPKECRHLIQCGALDGLGESRAAMLAELAQVARSGSVGQMAFGFVETAVSPETLTQRLEWEIALLGMPMSANPIQTVADQTADDVPLDLIHNLRNVKTTIAGTRLPGWTGGRGYYFGDGKQYILVQPDPTASKIKTWQPVRLSGQWRTDDWGGGWFQAAAFSKIGD